MSFPKKKEKKEAKGKVVSWKMTCRKMNFFYSVEVKTPMSDMVDSVAKN